MFLMLVGMLLEVLSITFIIPVLKIFLDINIIKEFPQINEIILTIFNYDLNQIDLNDEFRGKILIYGSIMLLVIFLCKNLFLAYLFWVQAKIIYQVRKFLSYNLFKKYMFQSYIFHLNRHSSDLLRIVIKEVNEFTNGIRMMLIITTEFLVLIGIFILVIIIEPKVASIVVLICIFTATLFYKIMSKKNVEWGNRRIANDGIVAKLINQYIFGIKEIKMSNRENFFLSKFHTPNRMSALMRRWQDFAITLPRLSMEMIMVMSLIALVFTIIAQNKSPENIIVIGGFFAAAAMRVIPSLNRILSSFQALKYAKSNFRLILKDFSLPDTEKSKNNRTNSEIKFTNALELKNLKFKYPESDKNIFNNLNMKIKQGNVVGLIGRSGGGKSTLINLISGLFKPTSGAILVDEKNIDSNVYSWQKQIGYIPQKIFISDETLVENIAFGVPDNEIDRKKVEEVVELARLNDFVKDSNKGLKEILGEKGDKISGGQIQRVAIARSLYNNPKLLILDEATNSLDLENAKAILDSLMNLKKKLTIIIVAHDKQHLEKCTEIYEVKNFGVTKIKG